MELGALILAPCGLASSGAALHALRKIALLGPVAMAAPGADGTGMVQLLAGAQEELRRPSGVEDRIALLRCGLDVLEGCDAVLVLVADAGLVDRAAVARLADVATRVGPLAAHAGYEHGPSYALLVRQPLLGEIRRTRSEQGLRALLTGVPATSLALGEPRVAA